MVSLTYIVETDFDFSGTPTLQYMHRVPPVLISRDVPDLHHAVPRPVKTRPGMLHVPHFHLKCKKARIQCWFLWHLSGVTVSQTKMSIPLFVIFI